MACCKCCCGNEDCSEGQEGKCCCGGAEGTCCQEGQYCCDGVCEDEPCDCETDDDCDGGVCCDGECVESINDCLICCCCDNDVIVDCREFNYSTSSPEYYDDCVTGVQSPIFGNTFGNADDCTFTRSFGPCEVSPP